MDTNSPKTNPTAMPVLSTIQQRFSPYRFDAREVEEEKIRICLEAARWAASSFNDQPWSWIIAKRQDTAAFDLMLSCLLEANQAWAGNAGVLLVSVIRTSFRHNGTPNRVALHDLGQAAAFLSLQASECGLQVHQMAGVNLSRLRQIYEIPEGHEPQTAIAVGYPDRSAVSNDQDRKWHERESAARSRLSLREQVFSGKWGLPADFTH